MSVVLEHKQGLIAGDGLLPVKMAQYAKENGFDVVAISLSNDNYKQLKKYCSKVYSFCPGEVQKIEKVLKTEEITQLTFLGKVSKTILIKRPKFDAKAVDFIKKAIRLNDDKVMLMIIEELENIGITILDQTLFIKNLMIPSGVLGKTQPSKEQIEDVNYGYWLAKEVGKLDVGQSVVIKDKMVMAKRLDIKAIGLKTLKTMKQYKADLIAVEAGETIIVDREEVIKFADKHGIVIMAV